MPKKPNAFITTYPFFSFLALCIISAALYLRFEPALTNTTHFSFDQAEDIILVKHLITDHKLSLVGRNSGLDGVFLGPLSTWIMTIPYTLSAGNPNANQAFLATLGILSTLATYVITRRTINRPTAFILTLLLAFSPAFISASHNVLSPSLLTFAAIIHFWLLYHAIFHHQLRLIPWIYLTLSLFFHFEIGYAIFALPISSLLLLFSFRSRLFLPRYLLPSIFLFILPFTPQIIFDFRHHHLISTNLHAFLIGTNQSLGSETIPFATRITDRYNNLLLDWQTTLGLSPDDPIFSLLLISTIILGWWLTLRSSTPHIKKALILCLSLILFTYTAFILFPGSIWPWYRSPLALFYLIASAIGLTTIFRCSPPFSLRFFSRIIAIFYLVIMPLTTLDLSTRYQILTGNYPGNVSTLNNQQLALDTIYTDAAGKPFALYIYTPPVYPYIWDYQLYWYAQPKYGYPPTITNIYPQPHNPTLVYLLIETGDYLPSRIQDWYQQFPPLGQPLQSWQVQSDIRIEKWSITTDPTNPRPLIREVNL